VLLKSGQKFWENVITKRSRLSDRMAGTWHTFHCSLEDSLKQITASVLKNCMRVPQIVDMKMHFRMLAVGGQVTDTLFLFGFYNNLYYTQGAHFKTIYTTHRVLILQQSILHTGCSFSLYKDA